MKQRCSHNLYTQNTYKLLSRKQYNASSLPSSESSEYDEESESDDDKKGLLIDISRKGQKMAATSSNRGRLDY